jgi:heptosyltransferase-3
VDCVGNETMKHITVIHMGAIGDLVQAMPTLRAVREKWPAARVLLVGRCERTALAQVAGLVDTCADFDAFSHAPPTSREADLVIDLFSAAMTKQSHAAGEVCHIEPLPPAGWTQPASVWILRQATARLDLPHVPETPELQVPQPLLDEARTMLAARGIGDRVAVLHAGSGSTKKNWPLDRFQEIARRLRSDAGRQVAWLSGPAELDRGTLAALGQDEAVLADLSLEQVAAVLALAEIYIGNDSGITQIAAAVRQPGGPSRASGSNGRATPTVALFGPTEPQIWGPQGPHGRIVRSGDGAVGNIDVDRVWAEVRMLTS